AEDGIRDFHVTGVQTCALPISCSAIQQGSYEDLQHCGRISLRRNGVLVQSGDWRAMVWSIPELIAEVSRYIRLHPGDLIFTGTQIGRASCRERVYVYAGGAWMT